MFPVYVSYLHGRPQKFFQGGKRQLFADPCQVSDDAMQMYFHETFCRFYSTAPQRKCPMLQQ